MSHDRFVRTQKFHVLPIYGVDPESLKKSSKNFSKDRENIGHNSRLNLLAKAYGVKGGFAGYQCEYAEKIKPFMAKHGLILHKDLITPKALEYCHNTAHIHALDAQQIADRLFVSGLPLPEKIFTGYDYDYERYTNAHWDYCHSEIDCSEYMVKGYSLPMLAEAERNPDRLIKCQHRERALMDLIMGAHMFMKVREIFNLLGDLLVTPRKECLTIPALYWEPGSSEETKKESLQALEVIGEYFCRHIEKGTAGWLSVIPYNENLIFLKGDGGYYDFVLRNMRTKSFSHQVYSPYLRRSEVPSAMSSLYTFQRWSYFEYNGWMAMDHHRAEQYYYAQGGTIASYPGEHQIHEAYFTNKGLFNPKKKALKGTAIPEVDFYEVDVRGGRMMISNLISIHDFMVFSNKNPDYFEWRKSITANQCPDLLEPMNSDDPHLPVAVTWYDACAYIKWLEDEYGLPLRLLKTDEYLPIREDDDLPPRQGIPEGFHRLDDPRLTLARGKESLISFIDETGKDLGAHPDYMNEQKFQNLKCVYKREPEYLSHKTGLKFVDADDFGEWLFENPYGREACCIRSLSLYPVNGGANVHRETQPAWSTGKYKHSKVGFRVCYEISQ